MVWEIRTNPDKGKEGGLKIQDFDGRTKWMAPNRTLIVARTRSVAQTRSVVRTPGLLLSLLSQCPVSYILAELP